MDREGILFPEALQQLEAFTQGWILPVVCMNSDGAVLAENCAIHGLSAPLCAFHRLVPLLVESGVDMRGTSSGDLHRLTSKPLEGRTHDALHDVRSMTCWLEEAGMPAALARMPFDLPSRDHRRPPARS